VTANAEAFQASAKCGDEILPAEWPAMSPGEEGIAGIWLWELFEEVLERRYRAG
jgi:hypothetical protein